MAIPKHDDLWFPALQLLSDGVARRYREFEEPLAQQFGLSDEELSQMYESGNGPIFYDRINWALSFLTIAGLVDRPKRGVVRITDEGRAMSSRPDQLAAYVRARASERRQQRAESQPPNARDEAVQPGEEVSELTPAEQLYDSFQGILRSVYDDLLDTILSKTPQEFENLVVKLLQRMGYGGQVRDAGEVTRYTSDGGIDGVIKEDVLGLGRVHIQAKRYARDRTVGREEVQRFVGALAVAQSKKGVFITTSRYSPGAVEYADSLHGSTTVVLIDGEELAKYIYDYGLGMQVEQTLEIKKLDSDFWDRMQDVE